MDKKVATCRICGIIISTNRNSEICPACERKESDTFHKVRDYLWENPGTNMQQVSKACNVPINTLRAWVREGKVEIVGYRLDADK